MISPRDITGKKFGQLTVQRISHSSPYGINWICECPCGGKRTIAYKVLKAAKNPACDSCMELRGRPSPFRDVIFKKNVNGFAIRTK